MAAKGAREKIRLVSSAETGHFYTTTKNKRNMPEKMEIKKFDRAPEKDSLRRDCVAKFLSLQKNLLMAL